MTWGDLGWIVSRVLASIALSLLVGLLMAGAILHWLGEPTPTPTVECRWEDPVTRVAELPFGSVVCGPVRDWSRVSLVAHAADRHAPLWLILTGARTGDLTRALAKGNPCAGSLCDGVLTSTSPKGVDVDGVLVTWREVADLIQPNITPGLLAAAATASRAYSATASDHPTYAQDPLWHEVVFRPTYRRCVGQLEACRQAFIRPPTVGQLALF